MSGSPPWEWRPVGAKLAAMGRARGQVVMGLVLAAVTGPDARADAREPSIARTVLPNGLTVLLVEDHAAPLVGFELRYKVGTSDEPPSRPGLAGLAQKLMVRATQHLAEGEYDRRLDAAGCFDSRWSTSLDRTIFRVTAPAHEIALPLWLWSDQMGFFAARVDAGLIERQLAGARNERAEKLENVPAGRVHELVDAQLYPPGHPYHAGTLRGAAGLGGVTVAEVRAFAEAHYTPDRAILVLAGDFETRHALALVQKYFASLPAGHARNRPAAARPLAVSETRLHIAARVPAASVTIAWPTPPFYEAGDAELDLLAELLAGNRVGRLRWRLVDELKIAASVSARQLSRELGSEFRIEAIAAPGHSAAELVEAIDGVLSEVQSAAPDRFVARGSMVGFLVDKVFDLEQPWVRAHVYADCEDHGLQHGCLTSWAARYMNIGPDALSRVAAQELPLRRRVVAEVTPSPDAPIAGEVRDRSTGLE